VLRDGAKKRLLGSFRPLLQLRHAALRLSGVDFPPHALGTM
jgi:hypothetical protein